ncbi:MAG TPA: hypothetical protein VFC90_01840 [Planctomycetota bacterium]|nr:hypothetical protein [Planctomycetota bacterium]
MAKPSVKEFLENRALLAIKLSSADLTGLFQKKFTIPPTTVGLVSFTDGPQARVDEGRELKGKYDLMLVKKGDVLIRFPLADLRSSDGFLVSTVIDLHLSIHATRSDLLQDFARTLFDFPGVYSLSDLKTALGPELRRAVGDYATRRTAAELHKRDHRTFFDAAVRPDLERILFGTGVALRKFGDVTFESSEYAQLAAAEARRADQARRHADLQGRKEERVRRLAEFLQEQSMRDLLDKIPDPRAKGLLYAKLMEDDNLHLDPRELAQRLTAGGNDLSELLFKTLENMLASSSGVTSEEIAVETAGRIYAAVGSKILEIDPKEPEARPREYSFRDPIRSVRALRGAAGPTLLVGCKRSVHVLTLGHDLECLEFPIPGDARPRGGVNAIAVADGWIYATHSEFGLLRWDRSRPGTGGEPIYESLTSGKKTTRGALVDGDRLVFAAGERLYSAPLTGNTEPVAYDTRLDSAITATSAGGGSLFAGTEGGAVAAWRLDEPDKATLLVRRKEPIVSLRLARIGSLPHLLYSARDLAVKARVLGQTLETSYEAGGKGVGLLDAASDLVCAVDASGHRVILWRAATPARPFAEVDLRKFSDKPALDIGLLKSTAEESARVSA